MFTARQMDIIEQDYTSRGEAFFHVSGGGHEGGALLHAHLQPEDMLSIHYRDKALCLSRGVTPTDYFLALFNKEASDSKGRQMNAHLSSAKLNIMSPTGPVGNSALHAVGAAETMVELDKPSTNDTQKNSATDKPQQPIVLCSLGDGMTQQGDVLEAIAQAARKQLPVLFFIQDNSFAISTKTAGKTFFSRADGEPDSFYGIPITRVDGRFPQHLINPFAKTVRAVRKQRNPQIIVMKVERLDSHTNADDHRVYRKEAEISDIRSISDPIKNLREHLIQEGVEEEALKAQEAKIRTTLQAEVKAAQYTEEPKDLGETKRPLPLELQYDAPEYRGTHDADGYTMLEAIREVLKEQLATNPAVELLGEDLEDPKGDVFGVTKGLSTEFPGRVENSPLAEASIVGLSVGRALAGKHPVAFLQFSDFLPIAYNQIASELASMYWRTNGAWQAPVIVMASAGGYKPGLGPYHASSSEAIAAHTPGIDVMYPSTAGDAAGMLQAAFASKRPTIFFYPKIALNESTTKTSKDIHKHLIPQGKGRLITTGQDLTIVTYGNGVKLASKAVASLQEAGLGVDFIDLRSISPWDTPLVEASARKTGKVLLIHEENRFGGVAAEVAAELAERVNRPLMIRRVTRDDTFVPCNFGSQLETLPSYKRILTTAVEMAGGTIAWQEAEHGNTENSTNAGIQTVEIIGTSPADEQAAVVEWHVAVGDSVEEGMLIADIEADKAAGEMNAPVTGVVTELFLEEGVPVPVGSPALAIEPAHSAGTAPQKAAPSAPTQEITGKPIITLDNLADSDNSGGPDNLGNPNNLAESNNSVNPNNSANLSQHSQVTSPTEVGIIDIASALGSRIVTNQEIAQLCPQWTPETIESTTGIVTRPWVAEGETALSLAVDAAKKVLAKHNLTMQDLGQIICTTGTPGINTPSLAARIQYELMVAAGGNKREILCPVLDISAACSGYLYGLQIAWDTLQHIPNKPVLLITSEVLSPYVNQEDHTTAPIFGDGATATLLGTQELLSKQALLGTQDATQSRVATQEPSENLWATFSRPITAGAGEPGNILRVPATPTEHIHMDGKQVYLEAIHHMIELLKRATTYDNITLADLNQIVPHQANQKIIDAVRKRLKLAPEKVYSEIAHRGNTSSSTIPLALESLLFSKNCKTGEAAPTGEALQTGQNAQTQGNATPSLQQGGHIGLTAFGGGFTSGATVLTLRH